MYKPNTNIQQKFDCSIAINKYQKMKEMTRDINKEGIKERMDAILHPTSHRCT
jgi:hypothetical protein